jgi:hypothetical protein
LIFAAILVAYLFLVLFAWALCVNAAPRRDVARRYGDAALTQIHAHHYGVGRKL